MPAPPDQLKLASRTLRALVRDADLPAKIGVHPRPEGSFGDAMPAWLRGSTDDGSADLLGIKWVTGFPNRPATGVPAIHATLLLTDATTGEPRAILDAAGITAVRTAAVSGVAIEHWAPRASAGPLTVGLVGAGVQGASHLAMLAGVLPGCRVSIHDRDADRATALAVRARESGTFGVVTTSDTAVEAIEGADVVITMVAFGPVRQSLPAAAFARAGLVITVDYDMCLPATVASSASLFLTDEMGQFLAKRSGGLFMGYPEPAAIMGERFDRPRPEGQVVVCHLGVGLTDVIFGDAILRRAERLRLGMLLPR